MIKMEIKAVRILRWQLLRCKLSEGSRKWVFEHPDAFELAANLVQNVIYLFKWSYFCAGGNLIVDWKEINQLIGLNLICAVKFGFLIKAA